MQAQIAESAYRYLRDVEDGRRSVVGVNLHNEAGAGEAGARFVLNPAVEARQRARLAAWRAGRDATLANAMLSQLEAVARAGGNVMETLVGCVEAGVTVGEIGGVLRAVFGEYQPPTAF